MFPYVETITVSGNSMSQNTAGMGRRALLTDSEREAIENPESKDNPYVAISRVRTKLEDELPRDVELLRENRPDLFEQLQEIVCDPEATESQEGHSTPAEPSPVEDRRSPEPTPEATENEPRERETEAESSDELEEQLQSTLPGSGSMLENRVNAVLEMYSHLQDRPDETVRTGELKELIDGNELGYASIDSFWTNAVKKNAAQDRPNSLTSLPGVEELGNGRYRYSAE